MWEHTKSHRKVFADLHTLKASRNIPGHQELLALGQIVEHKPSFFTIFVSHQWLGGQRTAWQKTEVMKAIHRYLLCSIVNVKKFIRVINSTSHNLSAGGHPDVHGNQFRNLQKALRKVIDGSIRLELDMTAQFLGHQKTLCLGSQLGGTLFFGSRFGGDIGVA